MEPKVGTRLIIKEKPKKWSSLNYEGKYPLHLSFPREIEIAKTGLSLSGIIAIIDTEGYGWSWRKIKDISEEVVPEDWYITITRENKEDVKTWWYSKFPEQIRAFSINGAYGIANSKPQSVWTTLREPKGKEITHEQFKNQIMKEIIINTQFITRDSLISLLSVSSCGKWRATIEKYLSDNMYAHGSHKIEINKSDLELLEEQGSQEQKEAVTKLGIRLEKDKSVIVENINIFMAIRSVGEYKNKAFYLSDRYNWDIKTDSTGALVLIPTEK